MANDCKNILVTGANGLIGQAAYNRLIELGHRVVGIDNNSRNHTNKTVNQSVIVSDVTDYLSSTDNKFDVVYHMAAINGTSNFYSKPNAVLYNNTMCDLAVIKFVESNASCKLIYASTSEVVAGTDCFPTPEETDISIIDLFNPRWSYRLPKILTENYLYNSKINFLIVRFFNIFSEHSGPGHFVRDVVDKIKKQEFSLIGADETRSFCYLHDIIDPLISLAATDCKIANLGSDKEISVLEAATIIAKHLGHHNVEWKFVKGNQGSVTRRIPDLTEIKKYVANFSPRNFDQVIQEIKHKL
jgi:nucleoside-diphosphate-sugar epimerase